MKWLLIIGIVIWILGGIVSVAFVIISATSDGRVSGEEAMPGILGGGACSCIGFVVAIVGLIMLLVNRSKASAPAAE